MALNFGNKTANGGADSQGILTAQEFNEMVSAINSNETNIGNKADKVTVIEVSGATPTQELAPNTFYKFTGSVTSLTITLGTPISGVLNIYAFSFVAGAANPTITLPSGVTVDGTPSIASGDYVEYNIMDNIALFKVISL